jgi:hypothetical protein
MSQGLSKTPPCIQFCVEEQENQCDWLRNLELNDPGEARAGTVKDKRKFNDIVGVLIGLFLLLMAFMYGICGLLARNWYLDDPPPADGEWCR